MKHKVLFSRTLKKTFQLISILMSIHQRKNVSMIKKLRLKINKLNDINIKLSSTNNSPNKCKTNDDNLGINNNKSHNSLLKIKDNKVISKFNNGSSNVSNNNKIYDNNSNKKKIIIIVTIMIIIITIILIMIMIMIIIILIIVIIIVTIMIMII